MWHRFTIAGGIAGFVLMRLIPAPAGLSDSAWAIAALTALMAFWWVTEALPLAATAMLPVVVIPALGVAPIDNVAPSYAHPLIFMFLGGFLIASALQRWGLHRRIAAGVLALSPNGPHALVGAVMVATAFLSLWISNTATAMLMIPIAQSVARSIRATGMAAVLVLAVAFSATIGGMGSLIGTPPNALLAGYLLTSHGIAVGFGQWLLLGVPMASFLLLTTWLVLTQVVFRSEMRHSARMVSVGPEPPIAGSNPMSRGAKLTAIVAALTGVGLLMRPALQSQFPALPLSDAMVVMIGAMLLFIIPAPAVSGSEPHGGLLRWEDAKKIRWDVLILFGGGLALAAAIDSSGLAQAVGSLFSTLSTLPVTVIVLSTMMTVVLLGELASNTAMAAVFLPVAGAAGSALGLAPLDLVLPIGLAASLGFMLPVATPPNAIAYGTDAVSSRQMMRAGALLDLATIPLVYGFAIWLGPVVINP